MIPQLTEPSAAMRAAHAAYSASYADPLISTFLILGALAALFSFLGFVVGVVEWLEGRAAQKREEKG
jgi:hypothetical protein